MSNSETSRDLMVYVRDDITNAWASLQDYRALRDDRTGEVRRMYAGMVRDRIAQLKRLFAIVHRERGY